MTTPVQYSLKAAVCTGTALLENFKADGWTVYTDPHGNSGIVDKAHILSFLQKSFGPTVGWGRPCPEGVTPRRWEKYQNALDGTYKRTGHVFSLYRGNTRIG